MADSAAAAGRAKASDRAIDSSMAPCAPASSPRWMVVESRGSSATPMATPTRPSGSWYNRSATDSHTRPPATKEAMKPEMNRLICVTLAASEPGSASRISALISGVSRGQRRSTRAPERLTPHQSRAACATPETTTAKLAA